jgi:two-component system response regulator MprA
VARILVVDDEPDVRELFNITLKMAGHVTETAKDGMEAVERLQADLPDLILLDLMMPRLDGFGLLTHIREKMDTKPVRVLVATAKVLEEADNEKLSPWPVVGVLNKGELDIAAMVGIVSTALSTDPLKKAVGESPKPPKDIPKTAPLVKPGDLLKPPVIIPGPTATPEAKPEVKGDGKSQELPPTADIPVPDSPRVIVISAPRLPEPPPAEKEPTDSPAKE